MAKRPNILWICTDQQRADTLGHAQVRTPYLDRLAGEGACFEEAYAQSPVCSPSRASFMTGRYPRTTRCRQNGQSLPADEVLVTRLLRDAGYRCGLAGKLHLSACHPQVLGGQPERRIDDGYEVFHWHHDQWPWAGYGEWLAARGIEGKAQPLDGVLHVEVGPPTAGTPTAWAAAMAADFIREAAADHRPWCFSLNTFDPHHPFRIPRDRLDAWRERMRELPLPAFHEGELADKPVWQRIDHGGAYGGRGMAFGELTEDEHRWIRAAYFAMVEDIDTHVGRLLEVLAETGQREHTIVIFMSDHGEMLGDHGIYLKGPYMYDCAVRVPLLLSWPGRWRARRSRALVELVDLGPTLLQACGLPVHPGMQGRSLLPLLSGASQAHRDDVYCEFYNANFSYDPPAHLSMVRTATHKLVVAHGQRRGELYDLANDPGEHCNVWDDPAAAEARAELLLRLTDRMAYTVDPLPEREAMF